MENGAQINVEGGSDIPFGRMLDEMGWGYAAGPNEYRIISVSLCSTEIAGSPHKPSATFGISTWFLQTHPKLI